MYRMVILRIASGPAILIVRIGAFTSETAYIKLL